MLSHVDPHGDTVFNRLQMSVLIEELLAIEPDLDGTALSSAHALRILIAAHAREPHRYLWFVGDRDLFTVGSHPTSRPTS